MANLLLINWTHSKQCYNNHEEEKYVQGHDFQPCSRHMSNRDMALLPNSGPYELSPFKSNHKRTSQLVKLDYQLTKNRVTRLGSSNNKLDLDNGKRGHSNDYGSKILIVMKLRIYLMVILVAMSANSYTIIIQVISIHISD